MRNGLESPTRGRRGVRRGSVKQITAWGDTLDLKCPVRGCLCAKPAHLQAGMHLESFEAHSSARETQGRGSTFKPKSTAHRNARPKPKLHGSIGSFYVNCCKRYV